MSLANTREVSKKISELKGILRRLKQTEPFYSSLRDYRQQQTGLVINESG